MEFFDTHTHYNDEQFDIDRVEIIEKTVNEGITKFVIPGYNVEFSKKAVEIANNYKNIYATCGISPNDLEDIISDGASLNSKLEQLEEIIKKNEKVVAVGEIGLDYYWNKENHEVQQEVFIKQIELANKYDLPIVIHTREAVVDTIDILKNRTVVKEKGIFHCCPFNGELVKEALKMGFYISFAGPVTFKNARNANEIIEMVPLDKILIETDSPYLSPEPYRGTRNSSINVKLIANKIAEIKGKTIEEIAKITYENAIKVFKI